MKEELRSRKTKRVEVKMRGCNRKKTISDNARRNSDCRLFACFPDCQKQRKLRYSANRFCDLAHRSERITGKHIAPAVERNLSRNAVIRYVSSRRQLTGSNCSSMERSFRQIRSQLSGKNAMNSSPFLLRF